MARRGREGTSKNIRGSPTGKNGREVSCIPLPSVDAAPRVSFLLHCVDGHAWLERLPEEKHVQYWQSTLDGWVRSTTPHIAHETNLL